jgi:serine/threonine-protein kinase
VSDPRDPQDADVTRTTTSAGTAGPTVTSGTGWLSSSGSIDHGRFPPGSLIEDRYRVIGLLGRGGMGEVYRADDLRLGQQVALKFLPPALATDARRLAQFHNEVRTARQVSHPNVCRVYDIGELKTGGESQIFITMEYVGGEDLSILLRRIGRLPEERAIELARQIAAGLAAAHERGVLHRDLKPANIMLDETGRVRIMDFSLAAAGAVDDIRAGTPAYMAPEQLEGREVTVRSDIYALGLVLYELFTGRRAFNAKSLADLVAQHQSGDVTSPSALVSSLDPAVDRAIMRCLETEPSRRPVSALAVAASLPGGDPLAAALAAGETPSPEMVAAAGGANAAVSAGAGRLWLLGVLAALAVLATVGDRVAFVSRSVFDKPPAVLVDRAAEFRKTLGYTDSPADRQWGYRYDTDVINWAVAARDGDAHWPKLTSPETAALFFWYRTSPRVMVPLDDNNAPGLSDPPLNLAGMTSLRLSMTGQLRQFEAVPPQVESSESATAGAGDNAVSPWDSAFRLAGLDASRFVEGAPAWTPRSFADARKAWTGTLPETGLPVRVEAAAYRGRLIYFEVIGDWSRPTRQQAAASAQPSWVSAMGTIVLWGLAIAAVYGSRKSLQSGRADRTGSFNLAAAIFLLFVVVWFVNPHVGDLNAEMDRFFLGMGLALMQAGLLYVIYLALEPFVRRHLPLTLVTWSRLTSGRVWDPLVGRDLLIGTALGAVIVAAALGYNILPAALGLPEPILNIHAAGVNALVSPRFALSFIVANIDWALQNAMLTTALLAILRQVTRSITVATVVTILVLVLLSNRQTSLATGHLWLDLSFIASIVAISIFVLRRFGLFAMVVTNYVTNIGNAFPLTLDGSRIYATQGFFVMAFIAALAGLGLWMARAGEPLLSPAASKPAPRA